MIIKYVSFLFILICLQAHRAEAKFPENANLLPAAANYERDSDCSEISPPPVFFVNGQQGPASRKGTEPLRPPDGLRTPVSQGEADLCFAYASAEAVTQRTGVNVSALDVATTYFFGDVDAVVDTKNAALRNELAASYPGVDLAAKIQLDRASVELLGTLADQNPAHAYIDVLAGGEETSAILMANAKGLCSDRDLPSDDGFKNHEQVLASFKTQVATGFAHVKPAVAGVGFYDAAAKAVNAMWTQYVDQRCKRVPNSIPLLSIGYSAAEDLEHWRKMESKAKATAEMYARIDYALNNGRVPIVSMDWYILEDPDGTDGTHDATIIGRKKVHGICHYLMRDNVNEPCENLHDKFQQRCNNGHIWLTESELAETMFGVTYLR